MKYLNTLILFLIFVIPSLGQGGYYKTDSSTFLGIKLMDLGKSNFYFCSVKRGDNLIQYTPFEISEYGFNSGTIYVSFDVIINGKKEKYFLERVVSGEIDLYYLELKQGIEKYYIFSRDSNNLRELPLNKIEARNILKSYVDSCPSASENLKYLEPNRSSLKRYLNYLNSCSTYDYPKVHYGLKIGFSGTKFYPVDKVGTYSIPDYQPDLSLRLGAFIDLPILSSYLSFTPEIYFKRNHYSSSFDDLNWSYDLIINYTSINLPLLFKYRFAKDGNIPFLQFGPVYSRIIKNNATLYQYEITDTEVFIEINDSPIIQPNIGGFSLGGGLLIDSGKKYKWFGEAGYNQLYILNRKDKNFNVGELYLTVGLQF